MVKKKKIFIILAGISVILLLVLFYPTEKRKIKRLLKSVAEWAQKTEKDTTLSIALKSRQSKKYFAQKVLLKIERREIEREFTIEDIERGYIFLMGSSASFKVTISDIQIEILDDFSAEADASVIVETRGRTIEELSSANEMNFGLTKTKEGWKINKIVVKEVLEK